MVEAKTKICFVGNIKSIHLQRWVDYFSKKKNYEVVVLSSHRDERYKNSFVYSDIIPIWARFLTILPKTSSIIFYFTIKNFLRKIKPDIVHIHQLTRFGAMVSYAATDMIIISVWGSDIRVLGGFIDRVLKRKALIKAEVVTVTSKFSQRLVEKTEKQVRTKIIPFGVDKDLFSPEKYPHGKKKDIIIGFAKSLKAIYGPDTLIRAFSEVVNEFPNTKLLIAGHGENEKELRELVSNLRLNDKIEFIGELKHEWMPNFLSRIDIFAMPSTVQESFGVAAIEASSMKVPVIASNTGGIPEVVKDNVSGLLVEPKDFKALAVAMKKLIKNDKLRKKMGESGALFVRKNFDWRSNTLEMETTYENLIKDR